MGRISDSPGTTKIEIIYYNKQKQLNFPHVIKNNILNKGYTYVKF